MKGILLFFAFTLIFLSACGELSTIDKVKKEALSTTSSGLDLRDIPDFSPRSIKLFHRSKEPGKYNYRLPSIIITKNDTVILFAAKRKRIKPGGRINIGDNGKEADLEFVRSTDMGRSFTKPQVLVTRKNTDVNSKAAVYDRRTGRIYKFFSYRPNGPIGDKGVSDWLNATSCEDARSKGYWMGLVYSDDEGRSWSRPIRVDLPFPKNARACRLGNGSHGIQLKSGRIVITAWYVVGMETHRTLLYTDSEDLTDRRSWRRGSSFKDNNDREIVEPGTCSKPPMPRKSLKIAPYESILIETSPDMIHWNYRTANGRRVAKWNYMGRRNTTDTCWINDLVDANVHAGSTVVRAPGKNFLMYSAPRPGNDITGEGDRKDLYLYISTDRGHKWDIRRQLHDGRSIYSDLGSFSDGTVGVFYESGDKESYDYFVFSRVSPKWVASGVKQCVPTRDSESSASECSNGIDDDCDGAIDKNDLSCHPKYEGIFRDNREIFNSNGQDGYCQYKDFDTFKCTTGEEDAKSYPAEMPESVKDLNYLGICPIPEKCIPTYKGIFRNNSKIYLSNGKDAFCQYKDFSTFMCMTGKSNANSFPYNPAGLAPLKDNGICEIPKRCIPTYKGIFRKSGKIFSSNGKDAYCQYKDLKTFKCMTGKPNANAYPVNPEGLHSLKNHGICSIPKRCIPTYKGIFRRNGDIFSSNGKDAYCQYKDLKTFKCMTGKPNANAYPVNPEGLHSLKNHGICSIPKRCIPKPPYKGIFRRNSKIFYSNGKNDYCQYKDLKTFKCMTGKSNANSFPINPQGIEFLKNDGICKIPSKCIPKPIGPVKGYLDGVAKVGAKVKINGWTCAQNYSKSIDAHIYIGGPSGSGTKYSVKANQSAESAVSKACGTNFQKYRFSLYLNESEAKKHSGKKVWAYGISPVRRKSGILVNSGKKNVPVMVVTPPPSGVVKGFLDGVIKLGNRVRIHGWTCAHGYSRSISTHIYIGGPAGHGTGYPVRANLSAESAVSKACGTGFKNYRFIFYLDESKAKKHSGQKVFAYGISPVGGSNNMLNNSGKRQVPVMVTPPAPVKITPVVEKAEPACSDKMCIKIIGSKFERDSYVDIRPVNSGKIIAAYKGSDRKQYKQNGKDVIEIRIKSKREKDLFKSRGLRVWVVNPQSKTWSEGKAVKRPAPPPYEGIFKKNSKIYYSNGKNAYCQYKDLKTFKCMTGKPNAKPYPVNPEGINSLANHGICRIPKKCLPKQKTGTKRCISRKNKTKKCAVEKKARNARVIKQISKVKCKKGENWKLRNGVITVKNGCGARFRYDIP